MIRGRIELIERKICEEVVCVVEKVVANGRKGVEGSGFYVGGSRR